MANETHIWIPLAEQLRQQAEWHEYQAAKKVWKRPWVYGERKRMVGRVKEILNVPFKGEKGQVQRWNPLQVAVFAVLAAGATEGADVIRVITPGDEKLQGYKANAEMDFSVTQLKGLLSKDSIFYSEVMHGHIRLEDEAANQMPREWVITPDGVLAPE